MLPQSFNVEEFKRDTALFAFLSSLKFRLDSICEKVDHTYIASGNEAMTAALETYAYIRTAARRTPGLQSVAEKLHDRFRNQGRRKADAGETPPESQS